MSLVNINKIVMYIIDIFVKKCFILQQIFSFNLPFQCFKFIHFNQANTAKYGRLCCRGNGDHPKCGRSEAKAGIGGLHLGIKKYSF
jgi:hypothetical protein